MLERSLVLVVAATMACGHAAAPAPPSALLSPPAPVSRTAAAAEREPAPGPARIPITTRSEAARAAFLEGRGFHEQGQGRAAKAAYERALALDPDFAQAHLFLAGATFGTPAAAAHFERVKQLAPALPELEQLWIALFLAMHAPDVNARQLAKQALQRAAPGDPQVWKWAGFWAESPEERRDAIEHAVRLSPDDPVLLNLLAYVHAESGQMEQAIATATRAVELLPGSPSVLDTQGEILLTAGRFDDAERAFTRALAADHEFAFAYQGIAAARVYRSDVRGGVAELRAGLAGAQPEMRPAIAEDLAWALVLAGDERAARGVFTELARSGSTDEIGKTERRVSLEIDAYHHRWKAVLAGLDPVAAGASPYGHARWQALEVIARLALDDAPGAARAAGALEAGPRPELARFARALVAGDHATAATALAALPQAEPLLERLAIDVADAAHQRGAVTALRTRRTARHRELREIAMGTGL